MPALTWFHVEKGIQRVRGTGMLGWSCHLRSTHTHREGSDDITFTMTAEGVGGIEVVTGASASLYSFVMALLSGPDLMVGTAVTKLVKQNAIKVTGSQGSRHQVVALNHQRQHGSSYRNGQQSQSRN